MPVIFWRETGKMSLDLCSSLATEVRTNVEGGREEMGNTMDYVGEMKLEYEKTTIGSLQDNLDQLCTKRSLARKLSEEMQQLRPKTIDVKDQISEIEQLPIEDGKYIKEIELFREYCGLKLVNADDSITLNFTNIDPGNSEKQFFTSLSLDNTSGTSQFALISADPHFDEVPELVSQLNESNDFHSFCEQLRKLYKRKVHVFINQ